MNLSKGCIINTYIFCAVEFAFIAFHPTCGSMLPQHGEYSVCDEETAFCMVGSSECIE